MSLTAPTKGIYCTVLDDTNFWSFKDGAYFYRSIFVQFMTMQEKQILARVMEI